MTVPRRLLPDISTLQAFECAARHGSFTRAGLELSLTQSAISRQIKDLELRLGVELFERVRQRAVLSGAGKRFLPEARRLLAQMEETVVRAMAGGAAEDVLSIATLPTFGARWLMPRLPDFLANHPGTVVNVASRTERFDFNEGEQFDLAIHYGQPIWAGAQCKFLFNENVVPVSGPRLASAARSAGTLLNMPLLHLATRPRLWSDWFEASGQENDAALRGSRFDQFTIIIEAAIAGMGVGLLPIYLIEKEVSSGQLMVVSDRWVATDSAYYLVVPDAQIQSQISRSFQDWISGQV